MHGTNSMGGRRGATGAAGAAYAEWMAANPGRPAVPGILKCLSLRPDLFRGMVDVSDRVHFSEGHLTRGSRR